MKVLSCLFLTLLSNAAFGKADADVAALEKRITALEKQVEEQKPGLGEIMGVIQEHHLKLYFAGMSENWDLADYELDEIKEGLAEAVKYHDHFKELKAPLSTLVPVITDSPLADLEQALKQKSKTVFASKFHGLTAACNSCHQTAQHGFVVIQDPKEIDFSNQKYDR